MENEINDIEDIIKDDDITPEGRMYNHSHVTMRTRIAKTFPMNKEFESDSVIPGTQTIYIKTWGCTHNNSDSEYMAGQLSTYGYEITTTDPLNSDLWLLNSCTVKNPAEEGFKNEIKQGRQLGKFIVVAGCVPQGEPRGKFIEGFSVIGVQQIDRVLEVVEETLKGHTVRLLGHKKKDGQKCGGASLNLPKVRKNPLIEIIAINTGCLNQCTYCKTKHARGELGSYPPDEIVARAKQSFEEGVVELWLTSEDTGAYGKDIGVKLPDLLWEIVKVIPAGCMMRVGMTNPPYIQEYLEEISKILNHPSVYSFLHIPVQSASNGVLNDMKREYTIEDFKYTINFLKERIPDLTVATDLICGFPTETDEDFELSCKLVKEYQFPSLFINQFFPRPGTPAAKMRKLPTNEVKERTKRISAIFKSYFPYKHKLGRIQNVLITEVAKDKLSFVGHNKSYDQVLVKGEPGLMGKMVKVEIYETGKHFMKGKIIEKSEVVTPGLRTSLPKGVVSGVFQEEQLLSPLPSSIWTKMLHAGLFVLLFAIIVDICIMFHELREKHFSFT